MYFVTKKTVQLALAIMISVGQARCMFKDGAPIIETIIQRPIFPAPLPLLLPWDWNNVATVFEYFNRRYESNWFDQEIRSITVKLKKASPEELKAFERIIGQFKKSASEYLASHTWVDDRKPELPVPPNSEYIIVKRIVAPDSILHVWGDRHGGMWKNFYEKLKSDGILSPDGTIKDRHFFIFLGDYADRGAYGTETYISLASLWLKNPDKVVLLRGNHEDQELAEILSSHKHFGPLSFYRECEYKGIPDALRNRLMETWRQLPSALYLSFDGKEFGLFAHGGIEFGYNPNNLFSMKTKNGVVFEVIDPANFIDMRENVIKTLTENKTCSEAELKALRNDDVLYSGIPGFMGIDYTGDPKAQVSAVKGRGLCATQAFNSTIMQVNAEENKSTKSEQEEVQWCNKSFRGHQHSDEDFIENSRETGVAVIRRNSKNESELLSFNKGKIEKDDILTLFIANDTIAFKENPTLLENDKDSCLVISYDQKTHDWIARSERA
jgi:hypothetical protein